MNKIYDSKMFHLAIALLIGVGLAWGYDKWVKNESKKLTNGQDSKRN